MKCCRRLVPAVVLVLVAATSSGKADQTPSPAPPPQVPSADRTRPAPEALVLSKREPFIVVTPSELDFGTQVVGSTSLVQTLKLTGAEGASVTIESTSGDFAAAFTTPPSKTCDLGGPGFCAISVTFAPKQLGPTTASISLAIRAKEGPAAAMAILLKGKGVASCAPAFAFFGGDWLGSVSPVLLVILAYLVGLILVRWHMIAHPTRDLLRVEIEAVAQRVKALPPSAGQPAPKSDHIEALLQCARQLINERDRLTRLLDPLFWTRGQELAAWGYVHEAETQLASLLPAEEARAALEKAQAELRQEGSPVALDLAERSHIALAAAPGQQAPAGDPAAAVLLLARWRALLGDALGLLYDSKDTSFATLVSWHNKTMWLIGCGLLLIVSLAAALGNGILFLVGATGGLLSRLSRSLYRADVPTDYGASWTTLFLSPVVGALAGWSGILLIIMGAQSKLLGTAFNLLDWCNPYNPVALGLALLFGVSERAFDGILSQLETKVQSQTGTPQASQPAALSIATAATLRNGTTGQVYDQSLLVTGGKPPYKWTLGSGMLPAGLNLEPAGRISGTPTAAGVGTAKFTLQVTDATSQIKAQDFTIEVA